MYTGLASLAKDQQVFGSRATELLATKQSRNVLYKRGTNDKKLQIRHKKLIWKFCLVSRLYHFLLSSWGTNSCNRCHHDYLPRSGIPSRIQMVVFHKSAGEPTIYTIYLFPGSINVSGTECHSVAYIISFVTTERSYHQLFCRNNNMLSFLEDVRWRVSDVK